MAMTNQSSSPALIPGVLPEGLLPPTICGRSTQEVWESALATVGVAIAAGQRGQQGVPGPAGPPASVTFSTASTTLANGAQDVLVTLPSGDSAANYTWILVDSTYSATLLSPAPAIAYFSVQNAGTNVWQVVLTAPVPSTGWSIVRSKVVNQGS